jgi:hypothetical protein
MASKTEMANLAISHLGQGKEVANVDTERSSEALTMRRYLPIVIEMFLKDFPYSFCNVTETLDLVETDPTEEWAYSYRVPTDSLKPIRILSGIRNDSRQSRVPYKIVKDSQGELIYTDMEGAQLEYTQFVNDTSRYPIDVFLAMSFLLAGLAAPRLLGEDPFKMGQRAMEMYRHFKGKADAHDANDQQQEEPPDAEAIRAREA